MKYLVTGKEMKLLDDNTSSHFHVPSMVLMEQAAMNFVRELIAYYKLNENNRILVYKLIYSDFISIFAS